MKIQCSPKPSLALAGLAGILALQSFGGPYVSGRAVLRSPPALAEARSSDTHPADAGPADQPACALVPGMFGTGRGSWRGPEYGLGRLRAELAVSPRGSLMMMDAWVARIMPMGPRDPSIQGTLYGQICAIDPLEGPQPLAVVIGQWQQEPDGAGTFVAQILVEEEGSDLGLVPIGTVSGRFRTPAPGSGMGDRGPAALRWRVEN